MSDDQFLLWKADLDVRNSSVDSGLYSTERIYRHAHDEATRQKQPVGELWVPNLFASIGTGTSSPRREEADYLPMPGHYAAAESLHASGLDFDKLLAAVATIGRWAAAAVGFVIGGFCVLLIWAVLAPHLPFLFRLALSRLEPWAFEADRLLALARGVPTTAELHYGLVAGVLVVHCAVAWLVLWRRPGPLRKAGVTMLAFAATEVLVAWQALEGAFAPVCQHLYTKFPEACTLSVWQLGQSLAAHAPPMHTLAPEAWQGTALVVSAGLLVGAATHAALLIVVLLEDV